MSGRHQRRERSNPTVVDRISAIARRVGSAINPFRPAPARAAVSLGIVLGLVISLASVATGVVATNASHATAAPGVPTVQIANDLIGPAAASTTFSYTTSTANSLSATSGGTTFASGATVDTLSNLTASPAGTSTTSSTTLFGKTGVAASINEASGSPIALSNYTVTYSCHDNSGASADFSGTGSSIPASGASGLTAARMVNGATWVCTFTNTDTLPTTSCNTIYTVQGNDFGVAQNPGIYSLDPATGAQSKITAIPASLSQANGLAITTDGSAFYYVDSTSAGNVREYNAITGVTSVVADGNAPGTVVSGAINPVNGYYYYASFSGGTGTLFAFNTATNTSVVGAVGTFALPVPGGAGANVNGDIAFDSLGNLYIVESTGTTGGIAEVKGPIPTTAAGTTFATTVLTTGLPGATSDQGYNGITFESNGDLVVQKLHSGNAFLADEFVLNPNTAAILSTKASVTGELTDLASCSYNPTLILQKKVQGRFATTDQFNLSITGGGITAGNTATTSGSNNGVQAQQAGPVIAVSGTSYTITETAAAGANLANYTSAWECHDTLAGGSFTISGTGTSGSIPSFPNPTGPSGPDVLCTFTNSPLTPQLTVSKTVDKTTASPGQKINYTITAKNTGTAAFAAANPAKVIDNLSRVLDDATYNHDAVASAGALSYASPLLTWSGPLAVGATVTIKYSITVKNPDTGNKDLPNIILTPVGNCPATMPSGFGQNGPSGSASAGVSIDPRCVTDTKEPPAGPLPFTGAGDIPLELALVGILVGLGVFLSIAGRRRRPSSRN